MFTVSVTGLLIRISPPQLRGRVSGLSATAFLLGSIAGPLVGSGLVAISLRAPFIVYGVALLLVVVLVWWQLRNSELAGRAADDAAPMLTFTAALRHPTYRAALGGNFALGWMLFGVRASLLPLFVTAVLVQSEQFTGIALAVFSVGNVLLLPIAGRLADSMGRKPITITGLALLAVGSVLIGQTDNEWVFLAASLVAGMGSGAMNPPQNAAVADVLGAKARGGGVLAGFQMSADVGAVLAPLVAGFIAEQWSYGASFAVTGGIAAVGCLLWVVARETLPAEHADEHTAQDAVTEETCKDTRCG